MPNQRVFHSGQLGLECLGSALGHRWFGGMGQAIVAWLTWFLYWQQLLQAVGHCVCDLIYYETFCILILLLFSPALYFCTNRNHKGLDSTWIQANRLIAELYSKRKKQLWPWPSSFPSFQGWGSWDFMWMSCLRPDHGHSERVQWFSSQRLLTILKRSLMVGNGEVLLQSLEPSWTSCSSKICVTYPACHVVCAVVCCSAPPLPSWC